MALTPGPVTAGTTARAAALNQIIDLLRGLNSQTLDFLLKSQPASDFVIQLADNAAARKLIVKDSDGIEIAGIDSNGNLTSAGYLKLVITDTDGAVNGYVWVDDSEDVIKFVDSTGTVRSVIRVGDNADILGSGGAADGYVLTADGGGGAAWEAVPAGLTNPMTTNGDLITQAAGVPARLGLGAASNYLQVNGGGTAPVWGALAFTLSTAQAALGSDITLAASFQTLASVSLAAGTWLIMAHAMFDGVGSASESLAEIYNSTDAVVLAQARGTDINSSGGGEFVQLAMHWIVTLAATKTVILRALGPSVQRPTAISANNGCVINAVRLDK